MTSSFVKTYAFGGDFLELEPEINLELSIELSLDGFSFLVKEASTLLCLEHFAYAKQNDAIDYFEALKELFDQRELSKRKFQKTQIAYHSGAYVVIPKEIFDESKKEKYYQFCEPPKEQNLIVYDEIDSINCVGLYQIHKEAKSILDSFFPGNGLLSHVTSIIDWFQKTSGLDANDETVVIHLRQNGIDVFWFRNGRFQFFNSFDCKELTDYIYYLVFFLEQYQVKSEMNKAIVFGDSSVKKEFMEQVRAIFKDLSQVWPNECPHYSDFLSEDIRSRFQLLLNF